MSWAGVPEQAGNHRGFLAAPEMVTLPFQLKSQNSGPAGQRQAQRNEYLRTVDGNAVAVTPSRSSAEREGGALRPVGMASGKCGRVGALAIFAQVRHRGDARGELVVGLELAPVRLVMHRAAYERTAGYRSEDEPPHARTLHGDSPGAPVIVRLYTPSPAGAIEHVMLGAAPAKADAASRMLNMELSSVSPQSPSKIPTNSYSHLAARTSQTARLALGPRHMRNANCARAHQVSS